MATFLKCTFRNHLKRLLGVFARVGSRGLRQSRRPTKRCQASALHMRAPQKGWGINGITTLQSGFPLQLGADNLSNSFGGSSRPVSTGKSGKLTGSATGRLNEWFDTSAYTPPVPFTFGNLSRTLPDVRTQGINNWDIAIFKNTKFGPEERFGIQFRTEFFNTFNRTQFGYPNTSCCRPEQGGSNNSFGVVSSTANLPRLVQFALRFTF